MSDLRSLFIAALLVADIGWAAPPQLVVQGNGRGATACLACHGSNGAGNAQAGYPALAGLPEAYTIKQLGDFKNATRSHALMTPIAQAMNADEIKAAATYYAALPQVKAKPTTAAAVTSSGAILANRGAWDRGVPPCLKCHGIDGSGVAPHFPFIAGQHAFYIAAQLKNWQTGVRRNDPLNMMKSVADKLSADEIQAVAAYFSSLVPSQVKK